MNHTNTNVIDRPDKNWWINYFRKESLIGPPLQSHDTVYIVGDDPDTTKGDNDLYAIDAKKGTVQWSYEPEQTVTTPPVCDDGTVYVGTSTQRNRSDEIHAVDVTPDAYSRKWNFKTGNAIFSGLVLKNGTIYFLSKKNSLHAVDADTGTELWQQQLPYNGDNPYPGLFDDRQATMGPKFTPVVGNGMVFVASPPQEFNPGKRIFEDSIDVYAINAETGEIEWEIKLNFQCDRGVDLGGLRVHNGSVYVGANCNLFAIDATNGEIKWQLETPVNEKRPTTRPPQMHESYVTQPISTSETVYFGTETGVYAVDANSGTQRWKFPTWQLPVSDIDIIGGTLCVGGLFAVYFLDTATGEAQWRLEKEIDSLVVTKDAIYTGTPEGTLLAYPAEGYTRNCRNCETILTEYGDVDFCPECGAEVNPAGVTKIYDE